MLTLFHNRQTDNNYSGQSDPFRVFPAKAVTQKYLLFVPFRLS